MSGSLANRTGPLPQWTPIDMVQGVYETTAPNGTVWRLIAVYASDAVDAHPNGYTLVALDVPNQPETITAAHGLYHALDAAGMRIAADAIRADPEGARRQLGLREDPED